MATRLTPTALAKSPQISGSATGHGPIEGRITKQDRDFRAEKADRALVLHEQGMSRATIAGRLCVKPASVNGMVERAKQRRVGDPSPRLHSSKGA
jgi:hypothetical protein